MISILPEHAPPVSDKKARDDIYRLVVDRIEIYSGNKLEFIKQIYDMSTEIASQLMLFDWFFDTTGVAAECLDSICVYKNNVLDSHMTLHVKTIIKQKMQEI